MRGQVLSALILAAAACSAATAIDDDVAISIEVDKASAAIGQAARVTIAVVNNSSHSVGVLAPPCEAAFEVFDRQGLRVGPWVGRACALVAPAPAVIEPGRSLTIVRIWDGSAQGTAALPTHLPVGTYSVRARIVVNGKEKKSAPVTVSLSAPRI